MRLRAIVCFLLVSCLVVAAADAKKRKRRRRKAKVTAVKASKEATVAVTALMGPYKWGLSVDKVRKQLVSDYGKTIDPTIKKTKDAFEQDKLRRKKMARVVEIQKSYVEFVGKRTPWDVSLVDQEFAQKNGESLMYNWGARDRRFYFFHEEELYKVYIAFNSSIFQGKSFEDFAAVMEKRFGPYKREYKQTLQGEKKLAYLVWPPVGNTQLRAIDNTGFYGNFCLVLTDSQAAQRVDEKRAMNRTQPKGDSLVNSIVGASETKGDVNDDIVDRITGQDVAAPKADGTVAKKKVAGNDDTNAAPPTGDDVAPTSKKRPNKKLNRKNPLSGLDI
jgi:hypothetical protein